MQRIEIREAVIKQAQAFLLEPFAAFGLTKAEQEAARLVAFGMTTEDAADALGLTRSGLNYRLAPALKKLGLENSKDLTRQAMIELEKILFPMKEVKHDNDSDSG
jgi:DNA-binding CsgD family transcriptional regulator